VTAPYYADDYVTIYHGDCREVTAWLEADVLITDPPYGQAYSSHGVSRTSYSGRKSGNYGGNRRPVKTIIGDRDTSLRDVALDLWGGRPAIVFGALHLPPPAAVKQVGVFVKALDSGNLTAVAGVRRNLEAIYFLGSHPRGGGGRSAVFPTSAHAAGSPAGYAARAGGHPHTKPGDVMAALIELTSGAIADPFAGGGSTLVAAKRLGRKAIGVEVDERYCEIAAKRCAQGVLDFGAAS
jgi:site-specific DNA-methyltransferase (adenine-specific)